MNSKYKQGDRIAYVHPKTNEVIEAFISGVIPSTLVSGRFCYKLVKKGKRTNDLLMKTVEEIDTNPNVFLMTEAHEVLYGV